MIPKTNVKGAESSGTRLGGLEGLGEALALEGGVATPDRPHVPQGVAVREQDAARTGRAPGVAGGVDAAAQRLL